MSKPRKNDNIVQRALKSKVAQEVAAMVKPLVKKALINGGGGVGSYLGGGKGQQLGSFVGAKLSKLIGSGDYAVSDSIVTNSLFPKSRRKEMNVLSSFGDSRDSVRMKHREYITDITAGLNNTFSLQAFQLNPGLISTFPFLASIANSFEEYHIHGLVFEFVSTTSPYANSSSLGSIVLAAQYDAFNAPYANKQQMENSDYSISSNPSKNIMYGFECAGQTNPFYYVRNSLSLQPINLTDVGTFYVGVQNTTAFPAGSSLGELWVSYDISFRRPRIISTVSSISYIHWAYAQTTAGTSAFAPAVGDAISTQTYKTYGMFTNAYWSSSTLYLPGLAVNDVINIQMLMVLSAATTAAVNGPSFSVIGLTDHNILTRGTGAFSYANDRRIGFLASSTELQETTFYKVTGTALIPSITFSYVTLTTSAKYNFDMIINYCGSSTVFS